MGVAGPPQAPSRAPSPSTLHPSSPTGPQHESWDSCRESPAWPWSGGPGAAGKPLPRRRGCRAGPEPVGCARTDAMEAGAARRGQLARRRGCGRGLVQEPQGDGGMRSSGARRCVDTGQLEARRAAAGSGDGVTPQPALWQSRALCVEQLGAAGDAGCPGKGWVTGSDYGCCSQMTPVEELMGTTQGRGPASLGGPRGLPEAADQDCCRGGAGRPAGAPSPMGKPGGSPHGLRKPPLLGRTPVRVWEVRGAWLPVPPIPPQAMHLLPTRRHLLLVRARGRGREAGGGGAPPVAQPLPCEPHSGCSAETGQEGSLQPGSS